MMLTAPRSVGLADRYGIGAVIAGVFAMTAAAFGLLTLLDVNSPYLLLGGAFALQGLGMGLAFAPATGSIMAAVPVDKAGVGSAVNDTTRELGAALGIAVLGTIIGSAYRSSIDVSSVGLSSADESVARESIGGAVGVARHLPDGGPALLTQAQEAFVDAFRITNAISLAIILGAAAMVLVTLRRPASPSTGDELDPEIAVDELALAGAEVGAS